MTGGNVHLSPRNSSQIYIVYLLMHIEKGTRVVHPVADSTISITLSLNSGY